LAVIRLWLVDDDREVREEIAAALTRSADGLWLTGSFGTAREALQAVRGGEAFDVALIDLGLPEISGVELVRELRRLGVKAPLIALTMRSDDEAIFLALRAGAQGYLTKDTSPSELVAAVRGALAGAAPLSPHVSSRVVSHFWSRPPRWSDLVGQLTAREREILEILCTGASYREVATLLQIGEGTVQTHVKNIYEKLGVSSKAEAVRMALEFQGSADSAE
jgi:DNA-binding NarL/FixJ family response regulator